MSRESDFSDKCATIVAVIRRIELLIRGFEGGCEVTKGFINQSLTKIAHR